MKDTKGVILNVIAGVALVIAFNAAVFLPPFDHTTAFWAAYACSWVVAFLGVGLVVAASLGNGGVRLVYSFPLYYVSVLYLLVGMVANFGFIAAGSVPQWAVLLANIILALLFIVSYVTSAAGRDYIETQDQAKAQQTFFANQLRNQTQTLCSLTKGGQLAAAAKSLNDAARFSDPMSCPAAIGEEQAVLNAVNQAILSASNGNEAAAQAMITQAIALLEQRNRTVKMSK